MITGIIMASGLSRRMGQNKLIMDYLGKPIFSHIIDAAKKSNIDEIIVVTAYDEIIDYCTANNIKFVYNKSPENGQSESIRLGVEAANLESDFMFFVADQPLFTSQVIDEMIAFYNKNKNNIVIPKYKNTYGNPKIFPNKLRGQFLSKTEDVRGRKVILDNESLVQYYNLPDAKMFFDIDTITDYQNLIK